MQPISKEIKNNWRGTLVFFVIIGLVLSLGIAWLVHLRNVRPTPLGVGAVVVTTPKSLVTSYRAALVAVVSGARSAATASAAIDGAESALFGMRVPREFLDAHFRALVQVRALRGHVPALDLASTQSSIESSVAPVLAAVDAFDHEQSSP
jgi:hypothetical protein